MIQVTPVILCGGSGTRLWPLSRSQFPKQFLALHGENTLFQDAVRRISLLASNEYTVAPPCVVGNDEHRFLLLDQSTEVLFLMNMKIVLLDMNWLRQILNLH